MARVRELLVGLAVALLGLAMAMGAVEIGVRAMHLEPDRFWEYDPLLGTRHVAGKTGWWTQEDREFTVPVRINEQGWRDVTHSVEKPPGVFRILVLGDSFAEALQVPLEAAFPRVLEAELNRQAPRKVEVINTGVSGFGTAGQVLLLRRDGARYQPDLVLLAFYPGNDVMNNSPELEEALIPVYRPDGAIERIRPAKKHGRPAGRVATLLARSKAYHYARRILLNGHPDLARVLARWEKCWPATPACGSTSGTSTGRDNGRNRSARREACRASRWRRSCARPATASRFTITETVTGPPPAIVSSAASLPGFCSHAD